MKHYAIYQRMSLHIKIPTAIVCHKPQSIHSCEPLRGDLIIPNYGSWEVKRLSINHSDKLVQREMKRSRLTGVSLLFCFSDFTSSIQPHYIPSLPPLLFLHHNLWQRVRGYFMFRMMIPLTKIQEGHYRLIYARGEETAKSAKMFGALLVLSKTNKGTLSIKEHIQKFALNPICVVTL